MREARPTDLNYGHLGEPIYDSECQRWEFPRRPLIGRRLQPAGLPVLALQGSLEVFTRGPHSATERHRVIKDLTHQLPELFPAACLIEDLTQTSDAVIQVTASHEPTISEVLAFGRAVDVRSERLGIRTTPILACAAGQAGELVRIVQLAEKKLGWESKVDSKLGVPTAVNGEEGWWAGNGSPIQQLVFAETEGEPSYWLAVRYYGAISVLRPLLRSRPDLFNPHDSNKARLSQSRLDANHVATLSEQNGVPFCGVAFNPWNHQQIATVDRQGNWSVWFIDASLRVKRKVLGAITKSAGGPTLEAHELNSAAPHVAADGWGVVVWASDKDTIVVAARNAFAVFNVRSGSRQAQVPVLTSNKDSDWILDLKRGSRDACNVFVATSSCIFWLRISRSTEELEAADVTSNVQCLLSWRHFRDQNDISLCLNVHEVLARPAVDEDARHSLADATDYDDNIVMTKLLLYSRLSGLVTVFTFGYAMPLLEQSPFASDPYPLELPIREICLWGSTRNTLDVHSRSRILTVVLQAVSYQTSIEFMSSDLDQLNVAQFVDYYQLSLLTHNLTLLETLYADVNMDADFSENPPGTCAQIGVPRSPANGLNNFIVPDGLENEGYHSFEENSEGRSAQQDFEDVTAISKQLDEDPWTIPFGWLEKKVHAVLSEHSPSFNAGLETLFATVKAKSAWEDLPLETLHSMLNTTISVVDVDQSSAEFAQFLQNVSRVENEEPEGEVGESKRVNVSSISTPWMQNALKLGDNVRIVTIHDTLIEDWISPLSRGIPGRARIELEKLLRNLTANISLAGHGMRVVKEPDHNKEASPGDASGEISKFVLPVRRRASVTSIGKGKEPAARSSSPLAPSHIPHDVDSFLSSPFRALPTPERTPSVQSKSSASSLAAAEDPASVRLKAYASLALQSALPTNMSNMLNHWEIAAEPTTYDWEAAQQIFNDEDNSESEPQSEQRQRRRKRQRSDTFGSSSQPPSQNLGASQSQLAQVTQSNTQVTDSTVMPSQIEPSRPGAVLAKPSKKKKKQHARGF